MLELLLLVVAIGGLARLAVRRGGNWWVAALMALVGYFASATLGLALLGAPGYYVGGIGWLAVCLGGVIYFYGKGRRHRSTWRCPACMQFNEPTTLVCDCGHRAEIGTV